MIDLKAEMEMLGVFSHPAFGKYVIRGHEPIDMLWDLFDQLVGRSMATERESRDWARRHSAYFCRLLSGGKLLYPLEIPQSLFFDFHCMALLGQVIEVNEGYLDLAPDPVRVLNQLLVAGALDLRIPGLGPKFGVMNPDEVTRARLRQALDDPQT